MSFNIEEFKSRVRKDAAIVGSPFDLLGTVPNFNRDRVTSEELENIKATDYVYDVGHIVYCYEGAHAGKLYIFRGVDGRDVGQFDELGFISPGEKTRLFEFKGQIADFSETEGSSEGDIWRVSGDGETTIAVVIPSGNSITHTEVSATTGDMLVCVQKENDNNIWSVLQNNIDDEALIQKAYGEYAAGQIPVYTNTDGNRLSSSTVYIGDVVKIERNAQEAINHGTALISSATTKNIAVVNKDGNLEDSMVDVKVLQDLQKELGGEALAELPQNPTQGTLADMLQKYRDNNYSLGSNFDPISATTESNFKGEVQGIISASTNNVGFVVPVIILKSDDPENEKFIFEDFIPEGKEFVNVEARVRKDGANDDDIFFHVDFEIEKHNLQYWYKGNGESVLYHEDYGFSENENE